MELKPIVLPLFFTYCETLGFGVPSWVVKVDNIILIVGMKFIEGIRAEVDCLPVWAREGVGPGFNTALVVGWVVTDIWV